MSSFRKMKKRFKYQILNMKAGESLFIQWNPSKIDGAIVGEFVNYIGQMIPKDCGVVALPFEDIRVLDKEDALQYLDNIRTMVENSGVEAEKHAIDKR